jgi:hypothetical protein
MSRSHLILLPLAVLALLCVLAGCQRQADPAPPAAAPLPATIAAVAPVAPPSAAPPAGAVPRTAEENAEEDAVVRRLTAARNRGVFERYSNEHGARIQEHLAVIYRDNPAFREELKRPNSLLRDAIVGPVTLKWLAQFCRDFAILASDVDFDRQVTVSLAQVAAIEKAHPGWRAIVTSADFEDWIDRQPPGRRALLRLRRSGAAPQVNALIAQYLAERGKDRPSATQPAPPGRPVPPPLPGANVTFHYVAAALARPRLAPAIVERLLTLRTDTYPDQESFEADARRALRNLPLDANTMALIERYALVDGYRLDDAALARAGKAIPPDLLEKLGTLAGTSFASREEFDAALGMQAAASDAPAALTEQVRRDLAQASRVDHYQVPPTFAAQVAADSGVPKPVAQVFAGVEQIDYPTMDLLKSAFAWHVTVALGMCPPETGADPRRLADADIPAFATWLTDAEIVTPRAGSIAADITRLRTRASCTPGDLQLADGLAQAAFAAVRSKGAIVSRTNTMAPQQDRSDWAPSHCKCGRAASDGILYGFYPLWTVPGKRQLNFGLLSRIGLYGLRADDNGRLIDLDGIAVRSRDPGFGPRDLIETANTHMTEVDWVVSKHDWRAFSTSGAGDKAGMLDALRGHIVDLLGTPLGRDKHYTAVASLGLDPAPALGDGVTVDFQGFPPQDKALLDDFLKKLGGQLRAMKPARQLNLMVARAETGPHAMFGFANLNTLIEQVSDQPAGKGVPIDPDKPVGNSEDAKKRDMRILVFVPESTEMSTRALQSDIDNALTGARRQRVQRDIIPVFIYNGRDATQMSHDIIYAGDLFGGLGFWPLAYATGHDHPGGPAPATTALNPLLDYYYLHTDDLTALWENYFSFLCPYRLWLRWAVWATLLVALGVGTYYFTCTGCNERLDKNGFYLAGTLAVIALPFGLLLVLLVTDPGLNSVSGPFLLLYAAGGIVGFVLLVRYYYYRGKLVKP